jgi:hypothetical protein
VARARGWRRRGGTPEEQHASLVVGLTGRAGDGDGEPEPAPRPRRSAAYDGGVRETPPTPRDPAAEHARLILGMAAASRVYGGRETFVV